jgi:lipopolysaccharide transport system ATP-binding protein
MISDVAVRAQALRKVYRLYKKPSYRALDIMGLLPDKPHYFGEHLALNDVDLEIRKGEKVAIIGRNGAGKSTLLRLITGVIQPSSGQLEVNGTTQALLSLGTGFHPELTGRQNALAYLVNFGVIGDKATEMLDEIIDFAELEEYIDQPMKTYSTGMGMRLMFSAATMFAPDLLVIDEVLGVGDSYFQGKSFERIREICSTKGATLLLVTHDVFTASALCERMIWIDNGQVVIDADSPTVLKAYDAAIRQQEESRLRKKAMLNLQRLVEQQRDDLVPLVIELRSPTNTPSPAPVQIARIALVDGDKEVATAPIGESEADASAKLITDSGAWGEPTHWKERDARQMNNYGTALHKVGVAFLLPPYIASRADELSIVVEAGAEGEYDLEVVRIDKDLAGCSLGKLVSKPGQWTTFRASASGAAAPSLPERAIAAVEISNSASDHSGSHAAPAKAETMVTRSQAETLVRASETNGSGRVVLTSLRFVNRDSEDCLQLYHGQPVSILVGYRINDLALDENCQIVLAFKHKGVEDVYRLFCDSLRFDAAKGSEGVVRAHLDKLPLGPGEYSLTVLLAGEKYYDDRPTIFYSINPKVYWAKRGVLEIKVLSDSLIASGTTVVGTADWSFAAPDSVSQ